MNQEKPKLSPRALKIIHEIQEHNPSLDSKQTIKLAEFILIGGKVPKTAGSLAFARNSKTGQMFRQRLKTNKLR